MVTNVCATSDFLTINPGRSECCPTSNLTLLSMQGDAFEGSGDVKREGALPSSHKTSQSMLCLPPPPIRYHMVGQLSK